MEQEAAAKARAAAKQRADEKAEKDRRTAALRKAAEEKERAEAQDQKRLEQVLLERALVMSRTDMQGVKRSGLPEVVPKQEATAQRLADAKRIADARSAELVTRAKEQKEQRRASLRLRRASATGPLVTFADESSPMQTNDTHAQPPPVGAGQPASKRASLRASVQFATLSGRARQEAERRENARQIEARMLSIWWMCCAMHMCVHAR